ncbi:GNAT family N-acetyltransferase [Actinokineospora sp. NBRC 105648]|uniref:GNAT family N-acetyltransferase n=1 Tax=Actinokineospora sp. NBRC 105648 TaxID=3032206 RepID=UPI0024A049AD|nr:GNAT family N-acetyltransferase [Actinokineospora sp. NBRC 105648]GLZ42084.1 GCN5 family N-acetyltransferase [Actinokineospora sp. NBRC 105648]
MITTASPHHFERIREVSWAAGEMFREVGMDEIADMPTPPDEVLGAFADEHRAWVWIESLVVAGFLLAEEVGGCAHVAEVSVHPDYRGRGFGGHLLTHVGAWAWGQGMPAVTLTTFRDVPWNAPYYERLGFRVVEPSEALREVVAREALIGLDPALRVCMRRDVR